MRAYATTASKTKEKLGVLNVKRYKNVMSAAVVPSSDVIELWFHYEEVAMHFNELIIQYRLQLLSGLGALSAVVGYLIEKNVPEDHLRYARAYIATSVLVIFAAAVILDIFYYHPLLTGAVKALLEFEAAHKEINMSTLINDARYDGFTIPCINLKVSVIGSAYALVSLPLLGFTMFSWYVVYKKRGR